LRSASFHQRSAQERFTATKEKRAVCFITFRIGPPGNSSSRKRTSRKREANVKDKKNTPSHRVFAPRDYEKDGEEKTAWNDIGVAFENNKGGFTLQLCAVPVSGRCVLLPYEEREQRDQGLSEKTNSSGGSQSGKLSRG
jgi:hypothetical protein